MSEEEGGVYPDRNGIHRNENELCIHCGSRYGGHQSSGDHCPIGDIGEFVLDQQFEPVPVPSTADLANPEHYRTDDIECIDAMRGIAAASMRALLAKGVEPGKAAFMVHCQLDSLKYTWRLFTKDDPEVNVAKTHWYGRMSIGDDPRTDRAADGD